jgi:hypothetical protein
MPVHRTTAPVQPTPQLAFHSSIVAVTVDSNRATLQGLQIHLHILFELYAFT